MKDNQRKAMFAKLRRKRGGIIKGYFVGMKDDILHSLNLELPRKGKDKKIFEHDLIDVHGANYVKELEIKYRPLRLSKRKR